jgi:hypothetical protein
MDLDEQAESRTSAFDLLDALSRSGALSVDCAELHVIVAATHCFDKSLVATVVQGSVNPVEKVERSTLIMATTVHRESVNTIVRADQIDRVKEYSRVLFAQPQLEQK